MTPDRRVLPPASILTMVRMLAPAPGSPPTSAAAMLPMPCPISSRLKSVRGPLCILSTETADSRLSTLAISATVMTPIAMYKSSSEIAIGRGDDERGARHDPQDLGDPLAGLEERNAARREMGVTGEAIACRREIGVAFGRRQAAAHQFPWFGSEKSYVEVN